MYFSLNKVDLCKVWQVLMEKRRRWRISNISFEYEPKRIKDVYVCKYIFNNFY